MTNFFYKNDGSGVPRYRELSAIYDIFAFIESNLNIKNMSKISEGYDLLVSLLENHPRIGHVF